MQIETVLFALSDPLSLPCVAHTMRSAIDLIRPEHASAVGVGHFESGEPLLAKLNPPASGNLVQLLGGNLARVMMASAIHAGPDALLRYDVPPFRYRNWFATMGGHVQRVDRTGGERLAIPTYIEKNMKGSTRAELLFHEFLAYLHPQGLLAGERWDMAPLRSALRSALATDGPGEGGPRRPAAAAAAAAKRASSSRRARDLEARDEPAGGGSSFFLSDGTVVLGAALERPVYARRIEGLETCQACGQDVDGKPISHPHIRGLILLDTNSLPSEEWQTVGPNRAFQVDQNLNLDTFPL